MEELPSEVHVKAGTVIQTGSMLFSIDSTPGGPATRPGGPRDSLSYMSTGEPFECERGGLFAD